MDDTLLCRNVQHQYENILLVSSNIFFYCDHRLFNYSDINYSYYSVLLCVHNLGKLKYFLFIVFVYFGRF